MNEYTNFVGIDISKEKLDVCILEGSKVVVERCITNTLKALVTF